MHAVILENNISEQNISKRKHEKIDVLLLEVII